MNKSYGVQEYAILCGKIIEHMKSTGEWWEFFPTEISPFWYDETVAMEHFPLTENAILFSQSPGVSRHPLSQGGKEQGWKWKWEEETSSYHGPYYSILPIHEYDEKIVGYETAQKNIEDILWGILKCEVTWKPFKIIKQELAFHIENNIQLPKKHPDQRHKERLSQRNPRKIYERNCADCHKKITTTFIPERKERIVCEDCYRQLVY